MNDPSFTITEINKNPLALAMPFRFLEASGKSFTFQQDDGSGHMDLKPQPIRFARDYYLCAYPCTQEFWKLVIEQAPESGLESMPSEFMGLQRPVESVSWHQVQQFIGFLNHLLQQNKLEGMQGMGGQFALPSEVQWEFAAQGATEQPKLLFAGSQHLSTVAWFKKNSLNQTMPVGLKQANTLGLYDMSGNVWEWCGNDYDTISRDGESGNNEKDAIKSLRGGGNWRKPIFCRSRYRSSDPPDDRSNRIGFRLLFFPSSSSAAG